MPERPQSRPVSTSVMPKAALLVLLLNVISGSGLRAEQYEADLVVYGGTSSGVIAAVQARRMGRSVIIVGPDRHLGGLSAGGLGFTDTGNKAVIGGLSRDFYHRVWKKYQQEEAWVWQQRSDYGNKGQGTPALDGVNRTMWIFEPHVAEQVFEDYVREYEIPVHRDQWLDRQQGVVKSGGKIVSISMLSGDTFLGKMFIDATYEGDLMAAAGVNYHVGREANSVYNENWNGVQVGVLHHRHHFGTVGKPISPYVIPGDPASGVLSGVSAEPPGEYGSGDQRIQAYCYRYCATDHAQNRVPFPKPEGYDATRYELLLRVLNAGWRELFNKFDPLPNYKTDTNNHGPFSTDNIGMNYEYPEGSYQRRREILQEHRTYQQGLLWFLSNDPRVPDDVRKQMQQWGLAADEFTDNGNWPHQIYVREARRMIGRFVMTENHLTKKIPTPEPVGMGSYTIDSHNVQRYIMPDGSVQNEGDIGVGISPYTIAWGSLTPRQEQCENLLVSVCVSSSHIAFGSIRMEPVFMILGQSAATGGVMALEQGIPVQQVKYAELRAHLLEDGQVLDYVSPQKKVRVFVHPDKLPGVVVDDDKATLEGAWKSSSSTPQYVGNGYHHDGDLRDGSCRAIYQTALPAGGQWQVAITWPANPNRASSVRVLIRHADGTDMVEIDQRKSPEGRDAFQPLGKFRFTPDRPAVVEVTNRNTDGHVVIDAVQWLRTEP